MFKESAIANVFILLTPIVAVLIAVLYLSNPKTFIIQTYVVGFVLLFISKCSQFKKGKWFSFGASEMSKMFKKLYWSGYFIMIFSIFIALVSINH